jgi:T-complex protein 1 subunit gamma
VRTVTVEQPGGDREIDVKKYAKIEKLPGGSIEECRVLSGVMFQKDVVAPGRMRRKIRSPRVLLLDCPLEYKKGENQTNVELTREEDWCVTPGPTLAHMPSHIVFCVLQTRFSGRATRGHLRRVGMLATAAAHVLRCCAGRAALLKLEEEYIERQCAEIAKHKPDLVITEKGLSDLAMHFLTKAGISAIRRLRKTDNNRIARATGATIVHRHSLPLCHPALRR